MSANLLQHPGKMHALTDDLESFLHVLGWMTLRYVPATDSYTAFRRGMDLRKFDEHYQEEGHSAEGGDAKSDSLRGGSYPSQSFRPRCKTPLSKLLEGLKAPFKSLYDPPTEEDRNKVQVRPDSSDRELYRLWDRVDQYDQHIRHLQSPIWFVNEIKKALDLDGWPTNDASDLNLPIASGKQTERKMELHTSQLQYTQSQWAMSKAPSMTSKRTGSPTPEPSAKRRRRTPEVSGTRI